MISPLTTGDIKDIALIHQEALYGDFLPSLGSHFLTVLYKGIINSSLGFGFVARDETEIKGFIIGSFDMGKLFKEIIIKRGFLLCVSILFKVLYSPKIVKQLFESLFYSNKTVITEKAELVVIAIKKKYRGQGIGKELVSYLNNYFKEHKIYGYKVTVNQANSSANRFYTQLGFSYHSTFQMYNKNMNLYIYSLAAK